MFEALKKGYSRKRQNVKKNLRFEIQDMFVWYHCCAKRFGEISFLELAKKCTRPKQTKLNLDSVETNSSVSSTGAPETLESDMIHKTILGSNEINQLLTSPDKIRNLWKPRIKKLNSQMCNLAWCKIFQWCWKNVYKEEADDDGSFGKIIDNELRAFQEYMKFFCETKAQ